MKILVLAEKYPSNKNGYHNDFVHQRVKEYIKRGHSVMVGIRNSNEEDYCFEDVKVCNIGTIDKLKGVVESNNPDLICIHFLSDFYLPILENYNKQIVVWVHGYEALHWYRRLYDYNIYLVLKHFVGLLLLIFKRILFWKKVVRLSKNKEIYFIFVSKWMKKIAEKDHFVRFEKFKIIPNSIDIERFSYHAKVETDRLKIISIRPFGSKKYANDITIKTILDLSKRTFFRELQFAIYGEGKYFNELTSLLVKFDNVKIINTFVPNQDLPNIHKEYGVFLCPTRQDAQGVSMCEAMSSGLVPISSCNTAIPEFVTDKLSGLLNKNNPKQFANAIEYLYYHPQEFIQLSRNASKEIQLKCNSKLLIDREISLFALKS